MEIAKKLNINLMSEGRSPSFTTSAKIYTISIGNGIINNK